MANTENSSNQSSHSQHSNQATAPTVTVNTPNGAPSHNKPNPNMVMALVLCFMLIIGLAFAFFFKNREAGGINGNGELSEKEELQRLIDVERGVISPDSRAFTAALEGRISSILENTHSIQSEFAMMKAGYADIQEKLSRAGNELQGNMNTISRLGSENSALKNEITQLQALARNAQAYQNQAQQYAQSNAEKDALIAQLRGRPSNESMQQLRNTLNNEQITKAELRRKLEDLERKMLSMVDSSEVDGLTALQAQNDELRRQLQALQTKLDFGKLFVTSRDSLPASAQALYSELKGLEGFSEARIREAYTRIATDLNAQNLQQVRFATGSSILNFTDQTTITNKMNTTNPSDYFLVVGYASRTGDAASNEKLSAKRATSVASIVNQLKKEGQDVRAVYLGQTSRFSKSVNADNQLCEIWRIRK